LKKKERYRRMSNNTFQIVIAISSVILRSGVAALLKRMPGISVHPIEVTTPETLRSYLLLHKADLIIVEPNFGGWFDIVTLKSEIENARNAKFIAIQSTVMNADALKEYNDSFTIYDDMNTIIQKFTHLLLNKEEKTDDEQEALSQREKEIITQVVRGLTNKAIADKLCLSIHTVITHRRNIARKLQIHSPAGLTIYAIVNKLVELKDIEGNL